MVKINVDGSFVNSDSSGIAVVIQNCDNQMIAGNAKTVRVGSALDAEAYAALEGVLLASRGGYSDIILETDSDLLYRGFVKRPKEGCWGIEHIVQKIQQIADSFHMFEFVKIGRKVNNLADWVACQVRRKMSLGDWVSQPSSLVHIPNKDGLPVPP